LGERGNLASFFLFNSNIEPIFFYIKNSNIAHKKNNIGFILRNIAPRKKSHGSGRRFCKGSILLDNVTPFFLLWFYITLKFLLVLYYYINLFGSILLNRVLTFDFNSDIIAL